jgi:nucleoside-diphosphate-sugar epimerase
MKVLVTGANGFVGRAVCHRLLAEGWTVLGTIRRPVPLMAGAIPRTIGPLGPDTDWDSVLSDVDAVVHLAARVHVMRDRAADPLAEFRRINRDATLHLARRASRLGVTRFLFMSTVKVNGEETAAKPFDDNDPPAPADPYAVSKAEAEAGLAVLAATDGLGVTTIRPPLVYGPGVGGNFAALLRLVAKGWPLPLGAVHNRRSLVFVDTLADAVATALARPAEGARSFLVSDGEDVSTAELISRLAAAMKRPARLLPLSPALLRLAGRLTGKSAAVERLLGSLAVDSTGFRRTFDWTPPVSLADGLDATARWFLESGRPNL